MKILSIRIKNLASLEGFTEIDFTQEPLSSAGIFAITGPTGAGKSTILDALCLALYGKTPRYLQARESGVEIADIQGSAISQGDVRGILRDGTSEGFAEVDFIGVDGQRYRATWSVRRARGKADGSLQAFSIALKNINTNTEIPGRKTELHEEIERLVGLNFEQFTRSVLLAQGDFSAFLKAARDEKSSLLEKLTGTHIYSEISKQVFVNYRKEERELEDLNLQRTGISTLTPEELEAFELQKATLEHSIVSLEQEVEIFNWETIWHTQLLVLQSNLTAAHTAHDKANDAKQSSIGREHKLKQVEQIQITRAWVDNQQTTRNQLAEKAITLTQLQITLHALQQRKEEADSQLKTANDDVAAKIQKQEDAMPLLEQARGIDTLIREKSEQLNHAENEVKDADLYYSQQEQQLKIQQQQADLLLSAIENLKQWKDKNSTRQPIAENRELISSKLSDAGRLLDSLKLLSPQLETTQNAIELAKQLKIDHEAQSVSIKQILQTRLALYNTAYTDLSAIPIAALEIEKTAIDQILEDVITAEAHWKIFFNTQADLNVLMQKFANNKNELGNKAQLLAQIVDQIVIVKAERDTSLRMLNKARLAVAENVESLRSQLLTGDPCPVCGNTVHPYTMQHSQLDNVLQQLETEHERHEIAYTTCLATESSLQETSSRLKESVYLQEQEVHTKEAALQAYKKTWQSFIIYHDAAQIADEKKSTWLMHQLQHKRIEQKDRQNQIQSYATKKQALDTLQNGINDLDKQLNENANAIKDTERNLQSLQERCIQYNNEQLNSNKTLSEIELKLSDYFTAQNWLQHWKDNPVSFLQRISNFAEEWKTNIQKLEEDTRQHSVLSATIKAIREQLQSLSTELQKKRTLLASIKEQHNLLTQKRKSIFNGEAATTIESGLKQAVLTAQEVLKKGKTESERLNIEIARTATQKEALQKDITSLQQQADVLVKKIHQWIIVFNIQHDLELDLEKLLQLLNFSTEWMEGERANLRAIDDTVTQTQSVLHELTKQSVQHEGQRLSERSIAELNELLNTAKTVLQLRTQEKNEIRFRLQQDAKDKQKIGDLLSFIQAKALIVENWAKLNEVIGSADGKKFRQIAQEYTLDVLLSYANVHLEMLSKRYLLQRVPNTLGLQVLDQDMGNEVRTVYSLSGGESFLVSLSLALGLASLSSSRMKVESLFIDEGFGSLDPTTLNIAMDALERLHNQGRKVGVISHVQEMTERIPVQIKVSKQQSGRSKVEVIEP